MIDRRLLKNFDYILFLLTLLITLIGIAMIYSASYYRGQLFSSAGVSYPLRQLIWAAIGLFSLLAVIMIDYQKLMKYAYHLYGLNILLLILVFIFGTVSRGSQRWINLGFFSFQPSELIKITVILALACYLRDRKREIKRVRKLLVPFGLVLFPFILIIKQPDLGTAFILLPILLIMLYLAGAKPRHLAVIVLIGVLIVAPLTYHFVLKDYQKGRLKVFLNPDLDPLGVAYSLNQSKIAIGSGQFWGKGWLNGSQTHLQFLTAQYTDFIFPVVGEEWGFVGSSFLLLLYFFLLSRGVAIALRAKDSSGALLAAGLTMMISLHIFINIGMTMGMLPITGLPLPLMSYGGSSLLVTMLSVGLLLNINMRRFMF
ncbi:MAG: rod shape-determining protein RodA [Nitrospirae bacterium]|nr:rod shape-determining protein RodA [Nitrospirota bacterium]